MIIWITGVAPPMMKPDRWKIFNLSSETDIQVTQLRTLSVVEMVVNCAVNMSILLTEAEKRG